MTKTQLEVNGIIYNTIKEACEALDFNYNTFQQLKTDGYELVDIIKRLEEHKSKGKPKGNSKIVTYNNVKYDSINQACISLGVSVYKCRNYLFKGMSIEDTLTLLLTKKNGVWW